MVEHDASIECEIIFDLKRNQFKLKIKPMAIDFGIQLYL
ncbi:hypothetical protein VAEKB19_6520001 [Vibrio aestuarianus]|nr:hypothetical protein VAEKB19_6520001 [Vibrio aestuarianus]